MIPKKDNGKNEYDIIIASQPYRSRVSAEKKVKFVIEPMIKSLSKKGKLIVVHACGGDPANKIIKKVWPKEIPFPSLYPQILKYIKSNLDKDRFRKDLGDLIPAYTEVAKRLGILHEQSNVSAVNVTKLSSVKKKSK